MNLQAKLVPFKDRYAMCWLDISQKGSKESLRVRFENFMSKEDSQKVTNVFLSIHNLKGQVQEINKVLEKYSIEEVIVAFEKTSDDLIHNN